MTRPLFPALALSAGLAAGLTALPAQAFDLENMSEAEREAFRGEIRSYLLDNPEVIMEAVEVLEERQADQQAQADEALVAANEDAIFDDGHSWVGGNPEGDITLVEFMDYRCGYCRRAAPQVADLLDFDGNIRLIVKEFPILGEQSVMASRFAVAVLQKAGDDAYKAAHDTLMAFSGDITEPALRRIAGDLGLPADEIVTHMESDEVAQVIDANHALGRKLGISGTPSFVMEDQMLRGYLPLDEMQRVAAELREEG
ncbi:DsbA family protein [Roseovarius aestuariivivens]|uniref:DsbA family protein n=1 Tax=Roseovarius aestuariivivens TaxID=1888910 RepID=UPI0010803538|nr:DsbA family protein [Roseovarius aestuariivivens]